MRIMWWFGVTQGPSAIYPVDRAHTTFYSTLIKKLCVYRVPFSIYIASYLSKDADFNPPHLHFAPPEGLTAVEFRGNIRRQKTSVPGLSFPFVCMILRLAV